MTFVMVVVLVMMMCFGLYRSTFFLVNPIEQVKKMYDPSNPTGMAVKISCIAVALLMVALVFCAAFWVRDRHTVGNSGLVSHNYDK